MNKGSVQVYSEQPDAANTAPLRDHPDYHDVSSNAQSSSSSSWPAAEKGKGKGKSQTRDQQWHNDRWQGWSNSGWGQW